MLRIDAGLETALEKRPWSIPARFHSEAFPIRVGDALTPDRLLDRLGRLGYVVLTEPEIEPGRYRWYPDRKALDIGLRGFRDAGGSQEARRLRIEIADGRVRALRALDGGPDPGPTILLEPEVIGSLRTEVAEERHVLPLEAFPADLVHAILAAEDQRFFEHWGIDARAVLRALLANVRSGEVRQGGSTLTQQLAKNLYLTPARTLRRKIHEAVLAILLERRLTKREILQLYLNEIYLGRRGSRGIYGFREASRFYFGKDPKDLDVAECAMLAGLIKGPNRFAPNRNARRALARRNQVLDALLAEGWISPGEYEDAVRASLPVKIPTAPPEDVPYFTEYVREALEERFPSDRLETEGLRIHTTLDVSEQSAAEKAVARRLASLEAGGIDGLDAALVSIEPTSGRIRALVGGRSWAESPFNRAVHARRQAGSIFKPLVMAAAFERDERLGGAAFTATRLVDAASFDWEYDEGRRVWRPENYADVEFGRVRLPQVLELSINTGAARVAREVGIEAVHDVAVRFGFSPSLPRVPSLSLGAGEVTPLEVAEAYGAFVNGGLRVKARPITTVADASGTILYESVPETVRATSPRVAYLVLRLLEGVVDRGTARSIRQTGIPGPVAGKTGTTNDGRDAWFVGVTPDRVTVVWVGRDRGEGAGLTGAGAALPIWIDFHQAVAGDDGAVSFPPPAGVELARIDPRTGFLATSDCPGSRRLAFFEGTAPSAPCPLHPAVAFPRVRRPVLVDEPG